VEVRQHHAVGGQHGMDKERHRQGPSPPPGSRRRPSHLLPHVRRLHQRGPGLLGHARSTCPPHIQRVVQALALHHWAQKEERVLEIRSFVLPLSRTWTSSEPWRSEGRDVDNRRRSVMEKEARGEMRGLRKD
jgi:hypothetical protein